MLCIYIYIYIYNFLIYLIVTEIQDGVSIIGFDNRRLYPKIVHIVNLGLQPF